MKRTNKILDYFIVIASIALLAFIMVGNFLHGTNTAKIWVLIIFGITIWYTIGCFAFAFVDKDGWLFNWVWEQAPNRLYSLLAIYLFPIVIFFYFKRRKIK